VVLQDIFSKLALGRIKNIPQLDDEIRRIQTQFEDARQNVERDYSKNREKVMRKTQAGTRLDELIAELDADKEKKLAGLRAREAQQLEPLEKQRQVLKDLVGR
jgi:recombinational DNA repair ATPase RecF